MKKDILLPLKLNHGKLEIHFLPLCLHCDRNNFGSQRTSFKSDVRQLLLRFRQMCAHVWRKNLKNLKKSHAHEECSLENTVGKRFAKNPSLFCSHSQNCENKQTSQKTVFLPQFVHGRM